eukprot:SAG25_NODE_266_length_10666_cov_14.508943_8_plen_84_part_00
MVNRWLDDNVSSMLMPGDDGDGHGGDDAAVAAMQARIAQLRARRDHAGGTGAPSSGLAASSASTAAPQVRVRVRDNGIDHDKN